MGVTKFVARAVTKTRRQQAKMNNRLACDLGSSARAAAWCNVTAMLWGLPLCWVLVPRKWWWWERKKTPAKVDDRHHGYISYK